MDLRPLRIEHAQSRNLLRVAYDLRGGERNYQAVYRVLNSMGDAVWALRSEVWIATGLPLVEVHNELAFITRSVDGLSISHLGDEVRATGLLPGAEGWLQRHFPINKAA